MRKNSLITLLLAIFAVIASPAYANTTTLGGSLTGVLVQDTFILQQNDLAFAEELYFTAWQKECGVDINGWEIDIGIFDDSTSARTSQPGGSCSGDTHAVRVNAHNPPAPIPLGTPLRVDVDLWLTSWNTVRIADVEWVSDATFFPAVPDFGWFIDDAVHLGNQVYRHTVVIINDGTETIWLTAIRILQTVADYGADLVTAPWATGTAQADVQLGPGESVSFEVTTSGSAGIGEYIYLRFEIRVGGAANPVELVNYAKHEILVVAADSDQDGLSDMADNCIDVPNTDQIDVDLDGIGNICDPDLNNDCITNAIDLGILKSVFFSSDPIADLNSDGTVNVIDLGVFKARFFQPPGPSGLPDICD